MPVTAFGANIRFHCKRQGILQRELASRVGIAGEHLSRIVHGKKSPPALETVIKMANELGLKDDDRDEFIRLAGYSPIHEATEAQTRAVYGSRVRVRPEQALVRRIAVAEANLQQSIEELHAIRLALEDVLN